MPVRGGIAALFLALAALPWPPAAAFAQDENIIGIYTDPDALHVGISELQLAPGATAVIHFVLTRPFEGADPVYEVGTFELNCTPETAGVFAITGTTIVGDGINYDTPPDYAVEFLTPLTVRGDQQLLMSWEVTGVTTQTTGLLVASTSRPFITDGLAYLNADTGNLVPMTPSSGSQLVPVFTFNPAVPVEGSSFGGVKALFR